MGRRSREIQVMRIEEEATDSAHTGKTLGSGGTTSRASARDDAPKACRSPRDRHMLWPRPFMERCSWV